LLLRGRLGRQLVRLQDQLLALASMVERALLDSVEYLYGRDLEGARRLIAADGRINAWRYEAEADALALIATQQPMAYDLRVTAAILHIATELERIGDYAKGICRVALWLGERPPAKQLPQISTMAAKSCSMLRRSIDAFVREDVDLARAIPREDEEMDALYNEVNRELLARIVAAPGAMEQANQMLWVAHNLERSADRVTNICERVVFTVTGEMKEMDSENGAPGI
jgi:phosphate transport system protein